MNLFAGKSLINLKSLTGFVVVLFSTALLAAENDVRRDATVAAIQRVMPSVVNVGTENIVEFRRAVCFDRFDYQRSFAEAYFRAKPARIIDASFRRKNVRRGFAQLFDRDGETNALALGGDGNIQTN